VEHRRRLLTAERVKYAPLTAAEAADNLEYRAQELHWLQTIIPHLNSKLASTAPGRGPAAGGGVGGAALDSGQLDRPRPATASGPTRRGMVTADGETAGPDAGGPTGTSGVTASTCGEWSI
jgi:hypothetical protein